VSVELTLAAGVLSLDITDNGCGLGEADLAKARSFGIRGLHERAGTVGGWIDLSSRPGQTTLILWVPLEPGAQFGTDDPDSDPDSGIEKRPGGEPAGRDDDHDPSAWAHPT
jgi:hypothetical protein